MESRKSFKVPVRIDSIVMWTFIVTILLALVTLAFRYKTKKPCIAAVIEMTSETSTHSHDKNFHTGEPVRFKAKTKGGKTFDWDFGDSSGNIMSGDSLTSYTFLEPGVYKVKVFVNGGCSSEVKITITEAPPKIDPKLKPRFLCPQEAEVGVPVLFKDSTVNATSWEWRFGENAGVDDTRQTATYTYKETGIKKVVLVINNNIELAGFCTIVVNVKKQVTKPGKFSPVDIAPYIPDKPNPDVTPIETPVVHEDIIKCNEYNPESWKEWFFKVADGKIKANELNGYLKNGDLNLNVTFRGKITTFEKMCVDLEKIKRKKINDFDIKIHEEPKTNCINGMTVVILDKRGKPY